MNADRIVVIEDGEVVEQGNHADLVVAKGRYADLWSKQTFLKPKDDDPTDGKQTDATDGETSESVNTQKANDKKPKDDSAHDENGKGANDANNGSEGKPNGHKKEVESVEDSSLTDSNH